jgi:DNA-binding NtrC family response regulator
MANSVSIIIADDEESFRESTSCLLRREGFECFCAEDAQDAIDRLESRHFDVLIADIRMPHNENMRVVRRAMELDAEMAVIVATGYPSTETAIQSVELPVAAYMTKPLDFDELLVRIHAVVATSRRRRAIAAVVERLETCIADLDSTRTQRRPIETETADVPERTIRTLAACLSELLSLLPSTAPDRRWQNLCELLDCPQQAVHRQAILEAIEVLKMTRDTFKSKPLAILRGKLEHLMGTS